MINEDPIIALAKNKTKHDFINVGELLAVLKGNVFSTSSDQAPVVIHSTNEESDLNLLKIVYKCGNCKALHLEAGDVDPNEIMMNEHSVIYSDYTHSKIGYISRSELIEILEKFIKNNSAESRVDIRTSDDNSNFPLTEIFKCSLSCPSVHLCSGYYAEEEK